jgi:hypothetical protein
MRLHVRQAWPWDPKAALSPAFQMLRQTLRECPENVTSLIMPHDQNELFDDLLITRM